MNHKKLVKIILILLLIYISCSCIRKKDLLYDDSVNFSNTQLSILSDYQIFSESSIKIMSFNIQIFGQSKMSKKEVVDVLVEIISEYDLIAIQEVRSNSLEPVLAFMSLVPNKYEYILGPREGRTNSKEQFWIIYNKEIFEVHSTNTWPDIDDAYERNPFGVYFKTRSDFDFILINNHIQPSDAKNEIDLLPNVIEYFKELWDESDVLILGDFNADGQYYNESLLEDVFPEPTFKIIISNEYDTTVADSDNTYDRFIITESTNEDYTGNFGILRFDELFDFTKMTILPRNISDHFPIWVEFYLNHDTD